MGRTEPLKTCGMSQSPRIRLEHVQQQAYSAEATHTGMQSKASFYSSLRAHVKQKETLHVAEHAGCRDIILLLVAWCSLIQQHYQKNVACFILLFGYQISCNTMLCMQS